MGDMFGCAAAAIGNTNLFCGRLEDGEACCNVVIFTDVVIIGAGVVCDHGQCCVQVEDLYLVCVGKLNVGGGGEALS